MQIEQPNIPGRTVAWRRLPEAHGGLLVSAVVLAILAYVAWVPGNWLMGGVLAALGALLCGAAALSRPLVGERVAVAFDRCTPIAYLLAPLIAAATVAVVSERTSIVEDQWYWFALWLASMTAVPFLAGWRIRLSSCPRWLAAYRWEIAAVAAMTAGATVARFVMLDSLPSPYSGDESTFALAGLSTIEDAITSPFRFGVHGAPTLYIYYVGALEKFFGDSVTVARASSALLGVVAIPITYLFLRSAFNLTIALCGGLFLAAFQFHIQFSREAMPNILDPVFIPLVLLFSYRALRDGKRIDYALAGLTLGLSLYAWISARLIPFEITALVGWWVLAKRQMPVNWLQGGAVALIAALIAAAPLGWQAYQHQDEFLNRLNAVGIHRGPEGVPTWYENERAKGRSGVEIYGKQFKDSFGTVVYTSDASLFYGAETPLIGPGVLIPLLIGVAWSIWRVREPRYLLGLVIFALPIITGGVLTLPAAAQHVRSGEFVSGASAARLLGVIPAVALLVGVGADRFGAMMAAGASSVPWLRSRLEMVALASAMALVGVLAFASLYFYFRLYDSEGYSEQLTARTEDVGEDMRSWVPAGMQLYLLDTDTTFNVLHPALIWGLRDYPVAVLDREGGTTYTANYRNHLVGPGSAAFLFVGDRLDNDLEQVMAACPGGTLKSAQMDDALLARAVYIVGDAYSAPSAGLHPCVAPASDARCGVATRRDPLRSTESCVR